MKRASLRLATGFLVFLFAGSAWPESLQYSLSEVAFDDGGIATGTFVYDTELDKITDWNVATSGGNEDPFPPFTYSPATSTVSRFDIGDLQPRIQFRESGVTGVVRGLRMTPTVPLVDGGDIPLQLGTAGGGVECFNCFPFRNITGGSFIAEDAPPAFLMNAGLNGSWLNPETGGQGFFLDVFPEIGQVFLGWFTYDVELPEPVDSAIVGSSGHRWLTAQGAYSGNTANLQVFLTTGGLFDDPKEVSNDLYGTMTLTFTSCQEGSLEYNFPGPGLSGTVPLRRIVDDPMNIALCDTLNTSD